ncbi:MAG: hypothetical protein DBW91_01740 [Candidatus Thioglobus sp.]|nr:MAG: hypothetical protein DBW91_01740 [Candidatus Thioglobus sp.]|tara:strand:+ start:2499 stop:3194 length:696 start_codon:yes stop_codon:yes gene_type:complete
MFKKITQQAQLLIQGTLLATLFISPVLADIANTDIPGINRSGDSYQVPADMQDWSTQDLSSLRTEHQKSLEAMRKHQLSQDAAEENMLAELLRHDLVRLSIVDVIPVLIEDYQIDGDFKHTLMGYRSTFMNELRASHDDIRSLGDYQAYDFRFAAVYMSMLYAFDSNPEFYQRLKSDMVNDATPIGRYRLSIDESYLSVKQASEKMDTIHQLNDLEKVIVALDSELERRKR